MTLRAAPRAGGGEGSEGSEGGCILARSWTARRWLTDWVGQLQCDRGSWGGACPCDKADAVRLLVRCTVAGGRPSLEEPLASDEADGLAVAGMREQL